MNKSDLTTLVQFNFWANGRILATCAHLTPDELRRQLTPDPGWGNLLEILVHTLDTEYGWRSILQQKDASDILQASDFADVAALERRWQVEKAAWLAYMASLNTESLSQGYGDNPQDGPQLWQTIMHVLMHGIQHRSEAAAVLTGYGHSPGELDFDLYLRENPDKSPGALDDG